MLFFDEINTRKLTLFYILGMSPINDTLRRKFFEDFAREEGFDPLVAVNWRRVKTETIEKRRVQKIVTFRCFLLCFFTIFIYLLIGWDLLLEGSKEGEKE
jgi:hypothetical protein